MAQDAYFDVRVFHPEAKSYVEQDIDALLVHHEQVKKRQYGERIVNVDRGAFCPLVFTTSGLAAPECIRFLKCLRGMMTRADTTHYSRIVCYVSCRLSFALLRAAIMCVRGARSAYHRPVNALRELAIVEGHLV